MTHFQPICFVRVPSPGLPTPTVIPGSPFGSATIPPTIKAPKSPQNGLSIIDMNRNDMTMNDGHKRENPQDLKDFENNCVSETVQEISDVELRTRDIRISHNEGCNRETSESLSSSQRHGRLLYSTIPPSSCPSVFRQLCKIGYLSETPGVRNISRDMVQDYFEVDSILVTLFDQLVACFSPFCEQTMQRYLVNAVTVLNNTHIRCLNTFIISAFDMAREVLITPKKLEFAREKEEELYKSLFQIAVAKGDEIREMIEKTIRDNWDKLVQKVEEYDFIGKVTHRPL